MGATALRSVARPVSWSTVEVEAEAEVVKVTELQVVQVVQVVQVQQPF